MVACFRVVRFVLMFRLCIGVVSYARVSGLRCGLGGFLVVFVDCLCCLRVDSVVVVVWVALLFDAVLDLVWFYLRFELTL